mgnify:CR=1 FL=1
MGIYLTTAIISIGISILAEKYGSKNVEMENERQYNKYFIWALILFLTLVAGFRFTSDIITDESRYRFRINVLKGVGFSQGLKTVERIEYGFYILKWVCANFFKSSQSFILITSFFICFSFIKTIERYTKHNLWLAVLIFISVGGYFDSMNLIMQYFAAAILLYGLPFIGKKKNIYYFLIVVCAMLFHTSAIMMFPMYLVLCNKSLVKFWRLAFVVSIMLYFLFDTIAKVVIPLVPYLTLYAKSITDGSYYGVNFIRVVAMVLPSVLLFYWYTYKGKSFPPIFMNMLLVSSMASIVSLAYVYVDRVNVYFIIARPVMFCLIPGMFHNKLKQYLTGEMALLFFMFGLYDTLYLSGYQNILFQVINGG